MRVTSWLEGLRQDLTFAVRQLKRSPAFALVAATTLALGIGANSAIFALVDRTVLRPLPFTEPERLVMLWERSERSPRGQVAPANLVDWNDRSRSIDRIGGYVPGVGGMVMSGKDGTAETVSRQWVTSGFFEVLDAKPIAGRTFRPSDDAARANAVVLSEAFWRARFDGDRTVVGRDIRLDGSLYTVVGVVPNEFQLLGRTSIWALAALDRNRASRDAYFLRAMGRLKRGVTIDSARSEMAAVAEGLAGEFPATNRGRSVTIDLMHDALIGSELRTTSMLFVGVVAIVLLICCANVANLLLARATVRTRELAIRSSLGAGRPRVIRQLLTESLVLAAIGGALGVAVGAAILSVAPPLIPQGLLPGAVTLGFDMRVLAFCAGAALLVALLFGIAPAWQATDMSSTTMVASDTRTTTGRSGRIRTILVGGEIATAVLLLFGAGLLLRTLLAVEGVDRGYRADRVLTMMVDPLGSRYPTPESLLQFFEGIERETMAIPGVRSVAWTSGLPLGPSDAGRYFFEIAGEAPAAESQRPTADYQIVSTAYFRTLDLPVVAGRAFDDRDTANSVAVCMVNEAFVRSYLRSRSPMGVRIAVRPAGSARATPVVREIVGVARQVKGRPDETDDLVQIYVPLAQQTMDDIYFVVRPATGRAEALTSAVRGAIARIDKEQLVSVRDVMTLEDVAWEATSRHRFRAVMVVAFAGLALLLAMVGVFGILTYAVQQRVRDFGVRRALGATTGDVLRIVIGSAAGVIATGVLIGLALSAVLGRLLSTMLFGVEPLDALTFAAVTFVLILTAAVSIAGPAWRATRIDPVVALRSE